MKILKLENVGCLKAISQPIDLGKKVFIYGLNGSGKSTVKKLFANLNIDGAKLVPAFGKSAAKCNALLEVLGNNYKYEKGKLKDISSDSIHVFDEAFVENSVYLNGEVKEDLKKEYYKIFVGRNVASSLQQFISKDFELNQKLQDNTFLLNKLENSILIMENFNKIHEEVSAFLALSIDTSYILDEAIKIELAKNLKSINNKSIAWLKTGRLIANNKETCPYCGQSIDFSLYNTLVSKYENLKLTSENLVNDNLNKAKNYIKQLSNIKFEELYFFENKIIEGIRDSLVEKLNKKIDNLSATIDASDGAYTDLLAKFEEHKKWVNDCKKFVDSIRINSVFEISPVEEDYSKNLVKSYEEVKNKCSILTEDTTSFFENLDQSCGINVAISKGVTSIIEEQNKLIDNNLEYVNQKLDQYNFKYNLELSAIEQKNQTSGYAPKLELLLVPKISQKDKKKISGSNIKNILSEGEKAILAWVCFLLEINNQFKKGKHLIIIDDPISSYDDYRRFNLRDEIQSLAEANEQNNATREILVLSHEKSFTNVFNFDNKFNTFVMKQGALVKTELYKINESDFKNDLLLLKDMNKISSKAEFIKFMVVSRNVIQYMQSIDEIIQISGENKQEYISMFNLASAVIHLEINDMDISKYQGCILKIYKALTGENLNIEFEKIDFYKLDLSSALDNISDIYLARVKLNYYLLRGLQSKNIKYEVTDVTGEFLKLAFKNSIIDEKKHNEIYAFLPILNVYNHVNDAYGLRRIDFSNEELEPIVNYVNRLNLDEFCKKD